MQVAWIAATTGFEASSTTLMTVSRLGSAIAAGVPNSLMSAPPENAAPPPVRTTALTWASASARRIDSTIERRNAMPSPLTGGLFIVMTATPSSTAYVVWLMLPPHLGSFDCRSAAVRCAVPRQCNSETRREWRRQPVVSTGRR
jgi:hypothetical protein